jgi:hypothetical protein
MTTAKWDKRRQSFVIQRLGDAVSVSMQGDISSFQVLTAAHQLDFFVCVCHRASDEGLVDAPRMVPLRGRTEISDERHPRSGGRHQTKSLRIF